MPKLPHDLETICLKCLRKEPAQRYADAAALADDLRRFLEGQPIQARPVGTLERAGKWIRRRPGVAALLLALAVVLIGSTAGMTYLWRRAEANAATAQQAVQRLQESENHRRELVQKLKTLNVNELKGVIRFAKFLDDNPDLDSLPLPDALRAFEKHKTPSQPSLESVHVPNMGTGISAGDFRGMMLAAPNMFGD